MPIACTWVTPNVDSFTSAGKTSLADFAFYPVRLRSTVIWVEADVNLFAETIRTTEAIRTLAFGITCSRARADTVRNTGATEAEIASLAGKFFAAAVEGVSSNVNALANAVDTDVTRCARFVARATRALSSLNSDREADTLPTPFASFALFPAAFQGVFAETERTTHPNNADFARLTFLRWVTTIPGVKSKSDVGAQALRANGLARAFDGTAVERVPDLENVADVGNIFGKGEAIGR